MDNQQESAAPSEKEHAKESPLKTSFSSAGGASLPPPPLELTAGRGMPVIQRQEDTDNESSDEEAFMDAFTFVVHPIGGPATRIFTGDPLYIWSDMDWEQFYALSFDGPPMILDMSVSGPDGLYEMEALQTDAAMPNQFSAELPGVYTVTATVRFDPFSPNWDRTVSSTFTLASRADDAQSAVGEVDPVPYEDFRVGLEIGNVALSQGGVAEQEFSADGTYITLASGDNPGALIRGMYRGEYGVVGFDHPELTRWYVLIPDPTDRTNAIMNNTGGEADSAAYERLGVASGAVLYNILNGTGESVVHLMFDPGSYTILGEGFNESEQPTGEIARYLQVVLSDAGEASLNNNQEYIQDVDNAMGDIGDGNEISLAAVYIPNDTLEPQTLNLFLGPRSEGEGFILVDGTPFASGERNSDVEVRHYEGNTLADVFRDFDQQNEYPDGTIAIEIPENDLGIEYTVAPISTNGSGIFGETSSVLGVIGTGLAIGAVFMPVLALPAGVVMAASGAFSLADHMQEARPNGVEIALDVLSIASGLIQAGSATRFISGRAQTMWYNGGRFVEIGGLVIDGVSTVIINARGLEQIGQILTNDQLSREEKISGVTQIIVQLAITDMLYGVALGGHINAQNRVDELIDDAILEVLTPGQRFQLSNFTDTSLIAISRLEGPELNRMLEIASFNFGVVNGALPSFAALDVTTRSQFLSNFPDNASVAQIFENWSQVGNYGTMFEVMAQERSSRPEDPASYLGQNYVDAHMQNFAEQGAAFVITPEAISNPSFTTLVPEKFVLLRSDMDAIVNQYVSSGSDITVLENGLGLGPGDLSGLDVYVIYLEPGAVNYGMPNGNELGANQWWLPGGMTPSGGREATIQGPAIVHDNDINNILNAFPHQQLSTATSP